MKRFTNLLILALALTMALPLAAQKRPKNIIFLIGDGMGVAQVYSAMVANKNHLEMATMKHMGLVKTYSSSHFTTDSGAGGTALACGVKTKNGMIGMNPDSIAVQSILALAGLNGYATGVVASCNITHATPASFVAHQIDRKMYEEIAADFVNAPLDLFIGGGRKNFEDRADGRNISNELKAKNFNIVYDMASIKAHQSGKIGALLYEEHNPAMPARGNMLPESTKEAIRILSKNKKGFFLMVEGSQIDWAGHDNNADNIILETLDFDKAVGAALAFARKNKKTLVIVTADHETGGMTLPNGNINRGTVKAAFSTNGHSGEPVPVFAFGPGAEEFMGFMENIDFKPKMKKLLRLK